jgi:hypothetical protein
MPMLPDMRYRLQVRGSVDDCVARSLGALKVTSGGSGSTVIVDVGEQSALIALIETLQEMEHELAAIEVQDDPSPAESVIRRLLRADPGSGREDDVLDAWAIVARPRGLVRGDPEYWLSAWRWYVERWH